MILEAPISGYCWAPTTVIAFSAPITAVNVAPANRNDWDSRSRKAKWTSIIHSSENFLHHQLSEGIVGYTKSSFLNQRFQHQQPWVRNITYLASWENVPCQSLWTKSSLCQPAWIVGGWSAQQPVLAGWSGRFVDLNLEWAMAVHEQRCRLARSKDPFLIKKPIQLFFWTSATQQLTTIISDQN